MPRSLLHIYACKIPECNKDTPEINHDQTVPWANATYGFNKTAMLKAKFKIWPNGLPIQTPTTV